jgi:hypothetical protein
MVSYASVDFELEVLVLVGAANALLLPVGGAVAF